MWSKKKKNWFVVYKFMRLDGDYYVAVIPVSGSLPLNGTQSFRRPLPRDLLPLAACDDCHK